MWHPPVGMTDTFLMSKQPLKLRTLLETELDNGNIEFVFSTGFRAIKVVAKTEKEAKQLAKSTLKGAL